MNYYGHMIVRLDGKSIEAHHDKHLDLVKRGIAGFIVFGGEREALRTFIRHLQEAALLPLIIASDLEQGVGQQIEGGTLFPPAMALAQAMLKENNTKDEQLMQKVFQGYAEESLYTGINTILAPVVDINTNPDNPIISVRSFGEDREIVASMSAIMIETLQRNGIVACAKHFPGHGDTDIDSHLTLPVVKKEMDDLERNEFYPFRKAVERNVKTMMLGHIAVPALDPDFLPASLSERVVKFLREKVNFHGILMTDALNMGGLTSFGQNRAGTLALSAGVDILLHPDDPESLNDYLKQENIPGNLARVEGFRTSLMIGSDRIPDFDEQRRLSMRITERSLRIETGIHEFSPSTIVMLKEDDKLSSGLFENYLRDRFRKAEYLEISGEDVPDLETIGGDTVTVLYSSTAAWKGRVPRWLRDTVEALKKRTSLFIVFGNPYIVHGIEKPKLLTYWCSEQAERAAVKKMDELFERT